MKSEPDVFSVGDLEKKKRTGWDGVRNYQARNYMRDQMQIGDGVFFYHSNAEPSGIAGLAKVCSKPKADPTQFDKKSEYFDPKASLERPIWQMVEVEFVERWSNTFTLQMLKNEPKLNKMPLVQKGTRLSVMPVSVEEWKWILKEASALGLR
jgi:predicted RNA-binding protein with PUA-like domain